MTRPPNPLAAALALAIREALVRKRRDRVEQRAKLAIVRGGKEESAA
jgi:hypothetical protein